MLCINSNAKISFKQMINLQGKKDGKNYTYHAEVHEQCEWTDFKSIFVDELSEYRLHYNNWIHRHQTRRDFVDLQTGRIPTHTVVCHFDFIHNIDVSVQWSDREKVAYMVSCDMFKDHHGCIIEESNHYFSDVKKHDWGASLTYIRKHLLFRKQQFQSKYSRTLKEAICYSDNGEIKCSGFLYKLGEILARNTSR